MNQCISLPPRLFCLGPRDDRQPVKASKAHRLGGSDDDLLNLDLAKEQLGSPSKDSYIPLFRSKTALHQEVSGERIICEIDTGKMEGVITYKTSAIISSMGSVAASPVPDYLGRGVIPKEAVKRLR